jgi:tripeptidyl-peptidase-1
VRLHDNSKNILEANIFILAMYNITQATKAAEGNMMGIFEEGDFYDAESLVLFFATFAP